MAELARKGMLSQQKPTAKPLNPEPPEPMPPPPPPPFRKTGPCRCLELRSTYAWNAGNRGPGRIPFFKALRKNTEGNLGALINTTRFEGVSNYIHLSSTGARFGSAAERWFVVYRT